jgi:hypothetical protein
MKWALDLVPIGIGVTLVAALTWFLLDRDIGLGKWLLAGLLLAHGWVHVMFVFPAPEAATASAGGLAYPFDMGRSWLISAGVEPGMIRTLGIVVMGLTLTGFVLAALATVGWLVPAAWWAGLVLASAAASTLMLIIFFSPALLLGLAINAALWVLVVASVWQPVTGGVSAA